MLRFLQMRCPFLTRPPGVPCARQGERKGTVFLKRHRVPKADGGFYGVADLNVGTTIDVRCGAARVTCVSSPPLCD
jgi:hypothetical protein